MLLSERPLRRPRGLAVSFAGGARADHLPQPRCARSLGTGRSESAVRIRDPFAQALDHRYALERKIGALPDWKGRKLFIVHALAFPYATIHQLALAPDAERGILIDRHDIADLPAALRRVIGYHRGARDRRPAPDEEGMQMLRDLLAPRVQIRVPMAAHFSDEEERLILLTHEQGSSRQPT